MLFRLNTKFGDDHFCYLIGKMSKFHFRECIFSFWWLVSHTISAQAFKLMDYKRRQNLAFNSQENHKFSLN